MSGNAARVQSAVQNLEYLLGNTRTGEALDYAKTNVLRRARPGASQVKYFNILLRRARKLGCDDRFRLLLY